MSILAGLIFRRNKEQRAPRTRISGTQAMSDAVAGKNQPALRDANLWLFSALLLLDILLIEYAVGVAP
jgi:hypothetical protein